MGQREEHYRHAEGAAPERSEKEKRAGRRDYQDELYGTGDAIEGRVDACDPVQYPEGAIEPRPVASGEPLDGSRADAACETERERERTRARTKI